MHRVRVDYRYPLLGVVSWYGDIAGQITNVHLSIHDNVPDPDPTDPATFSMPGTLLREWDLAPGQFSYEQYGEGNQGWLNVSMAYERPDHTNYFQINCVDFSVPFYQEQGKTYWLDVNVGVAEEASIGWKTSGSEQYLDSMVCWDLTYFEWNRLTDPTNGEPLDLAFVINGETGEPEYLDFGDAPEGGVAYPSLGTLGIFPTCMTVGPSAWIQHDNYGAWFGPLVDSEIDGNAGFCPQGCFPPYDQDECFEDGDAGLTNVPSYTIAGGVVVPCGSSTGSLGSVCQTAVWGTDVDILIHNWMPGHEPYATGYVNVVMDWDQNGRWSGSSTCQVAPAPEHVLTNFPIPPQFDGPLSTLGPPNFLIGPIPGYVWARFTLSEVPVNLPWDGSGTFEDGETEDYLLRIDGQEEEEEGLDICPKWLQEPDCEIGLDVESWTLKEGQDPIPGSGSAVADDWLCDGRPVIAVRWWGSYIGWQPGSSETNVVPPADQRPNGFFLTWYTDIPANGGFSRPGVALATGYYPLEQELTNEPPDLGLVVEYPYCVSDLGFIETNTYEHEYVYALVFPASNVWNEKEDRIYWISIEAAYDSDPTTNYWGWKTASTEWNWNDNAVFIQNETNEMI